MNQRELYVLLVEDDDIDSEIVARCLNYPASPFVLIVVNTASQALALLREQVLPQTFGKPYVILTDMRLPGIDGLEFLALLRQDLQLRASTIFILSNSENEQDKASASAYQIAGYLLKNKLDCDELRSLLAAYVPSGDG